MTKESQMTNSEQEPTPRFIFFVIRGSTLIRHSSFGFRHFDEFVSIRG